MKTIKTLSLFTLAIMVSIFLVKCNDDDSVTLYDVTGKVTYPDFSGSATDAAGAIVYLGTTEGSMAYEASALADANGNYKFANLTAGDYFIWANYDTKNRNLENARVASTLFISAQNPVAVSAASTLNVELVSMGQEEAEAVNTYEGGDWNSDLSHSNVDFEFPYDADNATYTGRFAEFEFAANFDPANLGSSEITGTIDVLSIKTNSPGGRDALYNADGTFWQDPETDEYDLGCVSGTFGVSSPEDDTRYATFTSSSIEAYGDGYLAKGNMNFNGSTSNINFFFKFIPGFTGTNRQGVETQFSSFEGFFDFAALADFGIESSHVQEEDVTVRISYQVTKPL